MAIRFANFDAHAFTLPGDVSDSCITTGISSNLPSGYNRDLQDGKKPLIESFEITKESLKVVNILINNIKPNEEKLKQGLTPEIFATHSALDLVFKGTPFREAYKVAAKGLLRYPNNLDEILKKSTHKGGTGNLCLDDFEKKIKQKQQQYKTINKDYQLAIKNLLREEE